MEIPVLLEHTSNGFRATTGGPLHFSVEGGTEAETIGRVNRMLSDLAQSGRGKLVAVGAPEAGDLSAIVAAFANDPFMGEWAEATRDVRRERESLNPIAEPDAA